MRQDKTKRGVEGEIGYGTSSKVKEIEKVEEEKMKRW